MLLPSLSSCKDSELQRKARGQGTDVKSTSPVAVIGLGLLDDSAVLAK